jgi:Beta-galactosidase
MTRTRFWLLMFLTLLLLLALGVFLLARKEKPVEITYGMSFNTLYARELGLDWQETYDAILNDLGVRHLRLAAHWPMVEPERGVYNFSELDYQIKRAEEEGAEVILAIGRRLPRWPECHVPTWAQGIPVSVRNDAQLEYMKLVIERYKSSPAIKIWQIENEPFLKAFAFEHCGELDTEFLDKEIAFVRTLDTTRPLLVTDSGNLGTWNGAYQRGDIFGTSVYVHFWNPELGQFRTFLPAWFYRAKENTMALIHGRKQAYLIELSAEPWLIEPIAQVPISVQFTRMDVEKFNDILDYAAATRFDTQYLWGAEWWYWLLLSGEPDFWQRGQELFLKETEE